MCFTVQNTYFLSVISDLVCCSLAFSLVAGMSFLADSAVTLELRILLTLLTLLKVKLSLSDEDSCGLEVKAPVVGFTTCIGRGGDPSTSVGSGKY